jgi:hypothetical protein
MKIFISLLLFVLITGCAETRVMRYQQTLDPLVGSAKKSKVNRLFGTPTFCKHHNDILETCEYRTAYARNDVVPDFAAKMPGFGPDLSPYDYFDVIKVSYDALGVVRDWEPVVIIQH